MNNQRILTKKAGCNPDMDMLRYFLDQKPTAFGFAIQDTSGKEPELSVDRERGPTPTMKDMEALLENAHPYNAMFYFGELGDKFNNDDIQPFLVKDDSGVPFMVIGLEGDFPDHADTKSGHSEAYNFATKVILPTIYDLCEFADGDLTKVWAKLNGDRFNELLLSNIGHRGSLTILSLEGDPIWLGKNELGDTYDWGRTSNEHDYDNYLAQIKRVSEEKAKAEVPPAELPKGKFSFRGKGSAHASPPPVPEAAPQDVATAGTATRTSVPNTTQAPVAASGKQTDLKERPPVKVPDWVHKNDDVQSWYRCVGGGVPSSWKKKPPIIPIIDKVPTNMLELKTLELERMKKEMAAPIAASTVTPPPAKTETSAGAPKSGAEIALQRASETKPQLNAKEVEEILEIVAAMPENKMSVAEMQDVEKKLGSFSGSVGCTFDEMMNWPFSGLFAVAGKHPKAMVLAFLEARAQIRELQKHVKVGDLVNTEHANDKVVTTTKKLGDNTTLTESIVEKHVLAKDELKPTGKKFSFRGKAAA